METDAFGLTSDPQLDGLPHQVAPAGASTSASATPAPPPGTTAPPPPAASLLAVAVSVGSATVGSAWLRNGAATISVPTAALGVGTHVFTVAYGGDSVYNPSSSTIALSVVARASKTTLRLPAATVDAGVSPQALVTVAAQGGTPTGIVEIRAAGRRIAQARLTRAGSARIKLPHNLAAGRHRLTAVYAGDSLDQGSESAAKLLAVRKPRARK